MPSAPSPICKPASFRRGLDLAARAPRRSPTSRGSRCQSRANLSLDASSVQAHARSLPAPRSRRSCPPAAATDLPPVRAATGAVDIDTAHPERAVRELQRAGDDDRISAGQRGRCRSRSSPSPACSWSRRTSATTFTAIDAVCTHEGCTVNGANGAIYVCPCHGSRYNRTGQVRERPGQGGTASVRHVPSRTAS